MTYRTSSSDSPPFDRLPARHALRISLVLRDGDPARYERAAVRWLGRFALEARDVAIEDLRVAAEALDVLPEQPGVAMEQLQRLSWLGRCIDQRRPARLPVWRNSLILGCVPGANLFERCESSRWARARWRPGRNKRLVGGEA